MRNFLLAVVLFLSSCGHTPADTENDTQVVDSITVMKDTTLPRPQSDVLDTIAPKGKVTLVRQDSSVIAEAMAKNTTAWWEIMDTMMGDLNRDQYMDMLIVLKGQDDDNLDSMATRPLLILIGTPDGKLKFVERNDNVVLCYHCGGIYGDPYDGLAIRNGYFSTEAYGGSSDRWTEIMTFKYVEAEKTWYLHRHAGISYSVFDPDMTEKEWRSNEEQWGQVKFADYNPHQ